MVSVRIVDVLKNNAIIHVATWIAYTGYVYGINVLSN